MVETPALQSQALLPRASEASQSSRLPKRQSQSSGPVTMGARRHWGFQPRLRAALAAPRPECDNEGARNHTAGLGQKTRYNSTRCWDRGAANHRPVTTTWRALKTCGCPGLSSPGIWTTESFPGGAPRVVCV